MPIVVDRTKTAVNLAESLVNGVITAADNDSEEVVSVKSPLIDDIIQHCSSELR